MPSGLGEPVCQSSHKAEIGTAISRSPNARDRGEGSGGFPAATAAHGGLFARGFVFLPATHREVFTRAGADREGVRYGVLNATSGPSTVPPELFVTTLKWYPVFGVRPVIFADTATGLVPDPGSDLHGAFDP